jgi:hypothetical protein
MARRTCRGLDLGRPWPRRWLQPLAAHQLDTGQRRHGHLANLLQLEPLCQQQPRPHQTEFGAPPDYDRTDNTYSNHNAFGRTDLNWVHKLEEGAKLDLKVALSDAHNTADSLQLAGSNGLPANLFRTVTSASSEQGFSTQGKFSTPFTFSKPAEGEPEATEHSVDGLGRRRDPARRHPHPARRRPAGQLADNSDEGFTAKVTRLALYGQDEWNITPRWSIYTGLRWEGLDTRADGGSIDAVQNRSSVFSPLMQTLIKLPNKKDQIRVALTRTYKAPSTAALIPRKFTSTNNSPTEPDRRGNPNLKPELALGLDASFEHYWGDGGLLSASASCAASRTTPTRACSTKTSAGSRPPSTTAAPKRAASSWKPSSRPRADRPCAQPRPARQRQPQLVAGGQRARPDNRLDQQVPLSATLGIDYKTPDGQMSTGSSFSFRNGGLARLSGTQGGYNSVRRDLDVYALWKLDRRTTCGWPCPTCWRRTTPPKACTTTPTARSTAPLWRAVKPSCG